MLREFLLTDVGFSLPFFNSNCLGPSQILISCMNCAPHMREKGQIDFLIAIFSAIVSWSENMFNS